MKKIHYILLLLVAGTIFSCKDEAEILPMDDTANSKFTFPQGNNSWDQDLLKIYDDFGVYMIYKNFTSADLNRSWQGGGAIGSATYQGEALTGDKIQEMTDFFKNHIFAYLNKNVTRKVLPMYWYMIKDFLVLTHADFGTMQADGLIPTGSFFDGIDFWAYCMDCKDGYYTMSMNGSILSNVPQPGFTAPQTQEEYYSKRCAVIEKILTIAFEQKNIVVPAEFSDKLDFKTTIVTAKGNYDNPNWYLTRGFADVVKSYSKTSLPSAPSTSGKEKLPPVALEAFKHHLFLSVYYSEAEFAEKYAGYTLLKEVHDFVVSYMKTNYNIDTEAIHNGPEEFK